MQSYTLELFRKDDTGFELRILQDQHLLSSHRVAQSGIDELLTTTAAHYNITARDLEQRGQLLFDWINQHSANWLENIRTQQPSLALTIDVSQAGLGHLPWELLHDGEHYLCAAPLHLFTPLRRVTPAERQHNWQAEKRQLGVLFMASSPEDIQPELDFEAEEAGILKATAKKPLDLQVEESGSLQGLEERLSEYEDSPDIIHISGHASIDEDSKQPVFLLENDVGLCQYVTPLDFARTLRDGNAKPKLVFLSGCRTGESGLDDGMLSFSEQVVEAGIPIVLGWALPVGDRAASDAAAILYEKLANGFNIAEAVAQCRQQLLENGSPYWHLLRCYVDGSTLNPLVQKGRLRVRQHNTQQKFLDAAEGSRVPVCSRTDFIGRRRLLQRCLKSLRAYPGEEDYAEGVLLYGMGGLGKSSAAARLIDRLHTHYQAIVIYGGLDETGLLATLSKSLLKSPSELQSLLNDSQQTLEQRLTILFDPDANPYCDKPLLLVLDDFEQNIPLAQHKLAKPDYHPECLKVLNSILLAIHHGQSDSRVIITSRFDVPVPTSCSLHKENPQSLQDTDLRKKLAQLPHLQLTNEAATQQTSQQSDDNQLRTRAIEIAAGNPRLLEWLDKVLGDGFDRLSVPALFRKLENKQAEFREAVLVDELLAAQPNAVRKTLVCAALYQLPVTLEAISVLRSSDETPQHLHGAAKIGLVEINHKQNTCHYFVSPLLDAALAETYATNELEQLASKAANHLYECNQDERTEALSLEIVRLAILGQQQALAVKVGDQIAGKMLFQDRYREAEKLCQQLLTLGDDYRVLTQLARAEQRLGRLEVRDHFERAVSLLPEDTQELDKGEIKAISNTLLNYGALLMQQGQLDEALALYKDQVLPMVDILNDDHKKANTMGQIADILQDRGQLDEALNIRQNDELPVYEKLGDVRSKAITMGKIADILQARGQLDEPLNIRQNEELPVYEKLGDVRSKAVSMGRIADILQSRGQLDEALNLRQNDELPVYEKLGDVRSKAVTMGQIADILQARGQLDEALNIRQNDELPAYNKLGDIREKALTVLKIAKILWSQNPADNAETVRNYLLESLAAFQQMQLPKEIEWVQNLFKETGLPLEEIINPKLVITISDGDTFYPEHYSHLFMAESDSEQRFQEGLRKIDIPYYSGNKHVSLWTGFHLADNENLVDINAEDFLDLLIQNVSLDTTTQKARVVESYPTLSQEQVDQLTEIFVNERPQFYELAKEHPNDTDYLQDKMIRDWLILEESLYTDD